MGKFKVGDLVRVYAEYGGSPVVFKAVVEEIFEDGLLGLGDGARWKDGDRLVDFTIVHPKWCNKLKKKPRRRFFLNVYRDSVTAHLTEEKAERWKYVDRIECIEVVEVRRKK